MRNSDDGDENEEQPTEEELQQRRAEAERERKKRQDLMKLKPPVTNYTGSATGIDPFSVVDLNDPYNNKGVTKANDYVDVELSAVKQANMVAHAVGGSLTKVENLTHNNVKTTLRELAVLRNVKDSEQVKSTLRFMFSPRALTELDQFAKLSDLRAKFEIEFKHATEERRATANLDLFMMSINRFCDLLEAHILPQLDETNAEQQQLPMRNQAQKAAQSMSKVIYNLHLGTMSSVAGITSTMVSLRKDITSNRSLKDYAETEAGSLVVGDELVRTLKADANRNEKSKSRFQWLQTRVPALTTGAGAKVHYEDILSDIMSTLQALHTAWTTIKGCLTTDQLTAVTMSHDELHRRLAIKDEVLRRVAGQQQHGTKRSNEPSSSSSNSSSSYVNAVKKGGDTSSKEDGTTDDGKKKKHKSDHGNNNKSKTATVDTDQLPDCKACGGKHQYHKQPGYTCPFLKFKHPQANKDEPTKAWAESKAGKAFKARSGKDRLQYGKAYTSEDATELSDFAMKKDVTFKKGA